MQQRYCAARIQTKYNRGQTALVTVVFFLMICLVILGTYSALAFTQLKASSESLLSNRAFATDEAGVEDAAYRLQAPQWSSFLKTGITYSLGLNGGTTNVTVAPNIDGDVSTFDYGITSRANVNSRYRSSQLNIRVPGDGLTLSIGGAMQIGYGGLKIGNSAIFESNISAGSGGGNAVSNGSVLAGTGNPRIDGTVVVSRGIGSVANQEVNISAPPSCVTLDTSDCVSIRYASGKSDGAQSFIPSLTAKPLKIRLYMKRSGVPSNAILSIQANKRIYPVTGAACISTDSPCVDMPDSSGSATIATFSVIATNIPQTWGWVDFNLTGTINHLVSNKKYWIVFDGATGFDAANYYLFGTPGNTYDYGDGTYYKKESDFCDEDVSHCAFTSKDSMYTEGTFLRFANYTVPTNGSGWENTLKDIGFQMYLGNVTNTITGDSNGKFAVTGDATAPQLRGVDIYKNAYYGSVVWPLTSPYNNNDEVLAGAVLPPSTKVQGNVSCRAPQGSPPQSYALSNYCQCRNEAGGTYCNPSPGYVEELDNPMFTYEDGPMPLQFIFDLKRNVPKTPISFGTISTPTTITTPAKISGNLVVRNGGQIELDSSSTDPQAYTIWLTGDLDVNSTSQPPAECKIKPKPRLDGRTDFNIYIIVDGAAQFQHTCTVEPFPDPSDRSYFYIVSTSPRMLGEGGISNPPDAVSINDNSSGSIFYATRGSVHLENNISVKSVAGHFIDVKDNSDVQYQEGYPAPFPGGGSGPQGASITEYHEIE